MPLFHSLNSLGHLHLSIFNPALTYALQVEPSQHKPEEKKKIVKERDAGTRNSNPSTNNSPTKEESDDKSADSQWMINRMINRPERMIHAEAHCTMDPIGMRSIYWRRREARAMTMTKKLEMSKRRRPKRLSWRKVMIRIGIVSEDVNAYANDERLSHLSSESTRRNYSVKSFSIHVSSHDDAVHHSSLTRVSLFDSHQTELLSSFSAVKTSLCSNRPIPSHPVLSPRNRQHRNWFKDHLPGTD